VHVRVRARVCVRVFSFRQLERLRSGAVRGAETRETPAAPTRPVRNTGNGSREAALSFNVILTTTP